MNDYYDELTHSIDAGSVLVTGTESSAFEEVGGSSEGEASTLPTEEINTPDETVQPTEGTNPPEETVQPTENEPAE